MSQSDIHQALIEHYDAGAFGLVTVYDNNSEATDPPNAGDWASTHYLPSGSTDHTQGTLGDDLLEGIFQINVNTPLGTGTVASNAYKEAILTHFKAGYDVTANGQAVRLRPPYASEGFKVNSNYRISITCPWFAHVSRA